MQKTTKETEAQQKIDLMESWGLSVFVKEHEDGCATATAFHYGRPMAAALHQSKAHAIFLLYERVCNQNRTIERVDW